MQNSTDPLLNIGAARVEAKDAKANALLKILDKGHRLRNDQMLWLREEGYIKDKEVVPLAKTEILPQMKRTMSPLDLLMDAMLDESIDDGHLATLIKKRMDETSIQEKVEEEASTEYGKKLSLYGTRDIQTSSWKMHKDEILNYSKEFYDWITAINEGFENVKYTNPKRFIYEPFENYKRQAIDMLSSPLPFNPLAPREEQKAIVRLERQRCLSNSLYGANKFLKLKDASIDTSGGSAFNAWQSQEISLYLFDCYLSFMVGKPRQIGETSVLGGAGLMRTMFTPAYFTKFITEKSEKGFEIFEDKVKYALYNYPDYIVPTVNNETEDLLRFIFKPSKGSSMGPNSKFKVEAPYVSAINGGTPDLVLLDEIGYIKILDGILNQGRPTMFKFNTITGRLELTRQVLGWGTGGKMDKGGGAMEVEWRSLKQSWADKDFSSLLVPVFFDTFAKPGVTWDFYFQQKTVYYNKGTEESKVDFHQTYPINDDDMFLRSSQTLLPVADINDHIIRCNKKFKTQYGYFQPLFDKSAPRDDLSDVPYKIIGAEFVPVESESSELAFVEMVEPPQKGWMWRYYEGTDPIFSSAGHSKMGAAIYDALTDSISCIVNVRTRSDEDHRICFLQTMLMGLYYDYENIKNLCEANVGAGYMDYVDSHGFKRTLVKANRLPTHLQTTGNKLGVKKQGHNAKFIIGKTQELINMFGKNINIATFWTQCKTYVKKSTVAGNESWQPENRKLYYDDVLDGVTYSYIARLCYQTFTPYQTDIDPETSRNKKVFKTKLRIENGRVTRTRRSDRSAGITIEPESANTITGNRYTKSSGRREQSERLKQLASNQGRGF